MDMSFYGGKQGKSFRISKVFQNKAELIRDLNARWNSSIGINELVFINYGNPGNKDIVVHTGEIIEIDGQKLPPAPKDLTLFEKNRFIDFNYEFSVYDEEQGQYVTKADGKLFNTTIWQKIYKDDIPIKTDTKIDPIKGIDRYMISDDFGVGYELVACLTGNTPEISVESSWIYTDQEPRAYLNKENYDAEKPLIHFDLPKGITLLYGPELTNRNATELRLDVTEKFGTGDYYINNTNGNTYLCTAVGAQVNGKKIYTVKYVATLAREVDEVTIESVNPYVSVDGSWKQQNAGVQNTINDETWNIKFTLPKLPTLSTSVSELLSPAQRQEIAVTGAVKDVDTYNFNFAIAKPSIWLNGTGAPGNETSGENGDYYLDNEGWGVYFKEGNAWNLITNIKGVKGDKGEKGDQGIQGEQGIQGIQGEKGDQGIQGIQGEKGDQGIQGIQGIQGEKGDTGEKGDKGDTGAPITVADYYDFIYDATVTGYTKVDTRKYKGNLNPRKAVDIPQFGAIAEEVYGHAATAANLFSMDYTDSEGETNGYWIFKTDAGVWDSIKVTGSAGSLAMLLQNTYDDTNSTDKTYTVNYTNTLISEFRNNFTSINNDLNQVVKVSSEQWKKGGVLTLEQNLLQKIKDTSAQIDNLALEISEDNDTMFDSIFSNMQNQINAAEASAEQATSVTLSFTVPLKSSGTGAWSTTSDSKTQVVLSIANKFTSDKQPMIICKDINNDDYGNIESISFDTNSITIIMSKENSKVINLFAFYPQ